MSVPQAPDPAEPAPRRGIELGSALLVLVGVALLLPGFCAFFSAVAALPMLWQDPTAAVPLGLLWGLCILVSYGGFKLISRSSRASGGSRDITRGAPPDGHA